MAAVAGSRKRGKRRLMGEINVVPYIDVMLVLLIIFMVTAPLLTQGVQVDLPEAEAKPLESSDVEPVVLTVDAEGRLYLNIGENPEQPLEEKQVFAYVSSVVRHQPQREVAVRADNSLNYGNVVQAMNLLQDAGVKSVGLITRNPEQPERAED